MKRPGLIRGILAIGIVYGVSGVIHRLNVHSCAHTQVRLQIDTENLAVEEVCAVETVLATLHEQEGHTLVDCMTQVQTQFPYLRAGTVVFDPGSLATYSFSCARPLCIVNNHYLLLHDGQIVGLAVFCTDAYAHLPAVSIDRALMQDEHQMRKIADAMCRIDPAITAVNAIHWQNIHTGFISAQEQSAFKVMFDVTHIPTAPTLAYCTTIHRELQDANVLSVGAWIADIRFNNQIIVYRGKGGGYG